jgi:valyl-tRNA synthetase
MEAREQIAKDLGDLGLIEKSEEMMHNVLTVIGQKLLLNLSCPVSGS